MGAAALARWERGVSTLGRVNPTYGPEAEAYREKVQAFLAEKLPADWAGIGQLEGDALGEFVTVWRTVLYEGGYLAPGWPIEYGGGGLSPLEQVIIAEEFAKAGVPTGGHNDVFGIQMLGNTLLQWGTEEQKQHYLPRILSGEDMWCQGYSRAQRRLRPRQPRPAGRARRRPVGAQRPEDLDVGGSPRRPHLHAGPHRPGRAQAQGHLVPARRHAPARHRGAPDPDDLRRRASSTRSSTPTPPARRTRSSAASTTAGRSP